MSDPYRDLADIEKKMKRTKVAEWWELWWCKPGEPPIKVNDGDYGARPSERIPLHAFLTREGARARLKWNKHYRVRHVVRYALSTQ